MEKWECSICGFVYDEAIGLLRDHIASGTKFEDIDPDWICPDCQMGKDRFELKKDTIA